jgi:DNA-binding NarL/FixJ family response regulator
LTPEQAALDAGGAIPPPSTRNELTAREIEVLQLVSEGLSDAEVAERLVVSPRTVHSHLRSIYRKLGVSSRSAATRYAVEHELTA